MGVSGCGKSSVGEALSQRCGIPFIEGDALHPPANIEKMSSGQPLNDDDRAPWLAEVGRSLAAGNDPAMIGCSALKRMYRDQIRAEVPEEVHFVHLAAPKAILAERVLQRKGHFMPPALLDSQFEALEALEADEIGTEIDISQSVNDVAAHAEAYVKKALALS